MQVATFTATIENGQVRLAADVRLPEKTTVYVIDVIVPDFVPMPRKQVTLAELVAQMPADYAPSEEDFGVPVGKEVW